MNRDQIETGTGFDADSVRIVVTEWFVSRVGHRVQAVELIRKKRDGDILSTAEIDWLVEQYTREQIPDYQMSAWLMAVYWRGTDVRGDRRMVLPAGGCCAEHEGLCTHVSPVG